MTSEQEKSSNGPVTVHVDPPLRRHRDRQPATPLKRRDVRAGDGQTRWTRERIGLGANCETIVDTMPTLGNGFGVPTFAKGSVPR
jgi:hypothetical protein